MSDETDGPIETPAEPVSAEPEPVIPVQEEYDPIKDAQPLGLAQMKTFYRKGPNVCFKILVTISLFSDGYASVNDEEGHKN